MPIDPSFNSINKHHYFFIHNVFGNFYKDTLDYFSDYLYPRFGWTVMGTYHKAVEYIGKQSELGREADKPQKSALILNPSGEFEIADAIAGGKQLWRFPNLAPQLVPRILDPIYTDDNIQVNVGFSRFKGEIELIMLLHSFYEYCDLRVLMLQIFGGQERYIYPLWFNSFIIFEPEVLNYLYENPITGESYNIDWLNNGAESRLVRTTNRNETVFPARIKPLYRLMSLTDGSEKYGGTDDIATWRLNATIEFEVEFPTYMLVQSDILHNSSHPAPIANISAGSVYSTNNDFAADVPTDIFRTDDGEFEPKTRMFHQLTTENIDSTSNIEIDLPYAMDTTADINTFLINTKYGTLDYLSHFTFTNEGNTLELLTGDFPQHFYINRLTNWVREKQPDGTYIKKETLQPRYLVINDVIQRSPGGDLIPKPSTSYKMTQSGKFIKDPVGEYVLRDNGDYEKRVLDDYDTINLDTGETLMMFEEGDFIELYQFRMREAPSDE